MNAARILQCSVAEVSSVFYMAFECCGNNVPLQWLASVGSNTDHDTSGLCSENRVTPQKYAFMVAKQDEFSYKNNRFRNSTPTKSV
jgi:hypothetical protein